MNLRSTLALVLFTCPPTFAADCAGHLVPRLSDYGVRVGSGPVLRHWAEISPFEALLAHVENCTAVPVSADYMAVRLMAAHAQTLLADLRDGRTDRVITKGFWIDCLESRDADARRSLWHAARELRRVGGLLPAAAFAWDDGFADAMRAWARDAGARGFDAPGMLVQLLRLRVGLILKNTYRHLDRGARRDRVARAQAKIEALFDHASAGARRDSRTERFAADVLSRYVVEAGPAALVDRSVDGAERLLRIWLEAGHNVVVTMIWREADFDPKWATLALPRDPATLPGPADGASRERAFVADGYLDAPDGRPAWVLLKDSRGTDFGSAGHVHVHIDYWRTHLRAVGALADL